MTTPKDTGGSAFPNPGEFGLTIRDWFAGKALAGFLANGLQRQIAQAIAEDENRALIQDTKARTAIVNELLASGCYALADAMLAERNKG